MLGPLVLVFLLAVLLGRLSLERTGWGPALLLLAAPLAALVLVALLGWRAGLVLWALMLGLALFVRWFFVVAASPWVLLLVLPVAAVTLAVLVSVVRKMAQRDPEQG